MKFLLRAVVVLVIAIGVGWLTDVAVLRRASVKGDYQAQVRLGAATAGLFAAGAATTVVLIAMAMGKKK